jgi:hypothetical protein
LDPICTFYIDLELYPTQRQSLLHLGHLLHASLEQYFAGEESTE